MYKIGGMAQQKSKLVAKKKQTERVPMGGKDQILTDFPINLTMPTTTSGGNKSLSLCQMKDMLRQGKVRKHTLSTEVLMGNGQNK